MIDNQLNNKMNKSTDLLTVFSQIEDPRSDINKLHNLTDILLIGIISVICAADTWKNMHAYAKAKEDFLRGFLELPNGIPSEDTFNRVFSSIDSEQFESCFIEWVNSLAKITEGEIVAIDGKTIRGAKSGGKKSPIHMVSAWAGKNNLVLGQTKVSEKSNEITAIPKLLDALSMEGSIVTIDAMGCQQEIAKKIVEKESNYILAVKENQKGLYEDIKDQFRFANSEQIDVDLHADHGRIESRTCTIITDLSNIRKVENWENLKTIIKIDSIREFKNSNKAKEKATRYYISSLQASPQDFQRAIRSHWYIENKLHWTLDVAFGEDASRKRAGNASQNFSILNKIALNLLKNEKTEKQGLKGKRLKAAWDNQYLINVLNLEV